jgi:hypothetical protein
MKKLILIVSVFILLGSKTYSQTTAQDFTRTDCDGRTWNLFTELDKGGIMLLQFDMMNCIYCTTAALNTDQIFKDYKVSNPGKLQMISLGYTNATLCSQMQAWKTQYSFTFACIEKAPAELAYYGAMGMPTIAIVGNKSHKVYYFKLGFTTADNTAMRNAINTALAESTTGILDLNTLSALSVYPNPAGITASVNFAFTEMTNVKIEVSNMLGEVVQSVTLGNQDAGNHTVDLNTSTLSNGLYIVSVNGNKTKLQVSN